MGTARMGASAATSACNPDGQCWDAHGLYVFDGSALPTSIGASQQFSKVKYRMRQLLPSAAKAGVIQVHIIQECQQEHFAVFQAF